MTVVVSLLLIAALFGFGLYLSIHAFVTPSASLASELQRAQRSADQEDRAFVAEMMARYGEIATTVSTTDLAVLGWPPHHWHQRRITFAALGAGFGAFVAVCLRIFIDFPLFLGVPVIAAAFGALATVFVEQDRGSKAEAKRAEIRLALTQYLELTSIMLAGGAGAETALEEAVSQGKSDEFKIFAREIARSKEKPTANSFTALRDLGYEIGVRDLVEFGNVMILAAENAATVRQALDAKASQIIVKEQEARKAEALSRNVLMELPVVGMAGGFILWLMYAAMAGLAGY